MVSTIIGDNETAFEEIIGFNKSYDIVKNKVNIGDRCAVYYFIQGFLQEDSMGRILYFLMEKGADYLNSPNIQTFASSAIPFSDHSPENSIEKLSEKLFSGRAILFIDGYNEGLVLDVKEFPSRGINEPEKGRTLRGPHDGFSEQLVTNTVLVRRRLASNKLRIERFTVGEETKTEIALLFMEGKADPTFINDVRNKLRNKKVKALNMAQESVTEKLLITKKSDLINPFPKVKYTDRPDNAAAMLCEGKIAIITDNSPTAIILPVSIFDFFESTDDYYFPPSSGTYLKIIRFLTFFASIFAIPIWLLFVHYSEWLSPSFAFVLVDEDYTVPLFMQFLIIEFAIDGLKLASLNTPDVMSGSLSIVGGLLLGDFAVQSGWFVTQTVLYSAFTAIAGFVPGSYELGYAFKFIRISLILGVTVGGFWGFFILLFAWCLIIAFNKTTAGKSYLFPLIPFSPSGLLRIFVKTSKGKEEA